MFQYWINAESYPVAKLRVNILLATKVTLTTDGIYFGMLRVNIVIQFHTQLGKHKTALPSAELLSTFSTTGTSALTVQERPAGSNCT
jgi:ABC-type enterochelin transport system permease subunit